jgi:hypothetical protein
MLNPMPAEAVNRPSDVQRRVLCSRYSECLEICLERGWQGFSCVRCNDFEFECPDDMVHWAEQGKNSKCLLMSAGYLPKWIVEKMKSRAESGHFACEYIQ